MLHLLLVYFSPWWDGLHIFSVFARKGQRRNERTEFGGNSRIKPIIEKKKKKKLTDSFGFFNMNSCSLARMLARCSGGITRSMTSLPLPATQFPHPSILPRIPLVAPSTPFCIPPAPPPGAFCVFSPAPLAVCWAWSAMLDRPTADEALFRGYGDEAREVACRMSSRFGWAVGRTSSLRGECVRGREEAILHGRARGCVPWGRGCVYALARGNGRRCGVIGLRGANFSCRRVSAQSRKLMMMMKWNGEIKPAFSAYCTVPTCCLPYLPSRILGDGSYRPPSYSHLPHCASSSSQPSHAVGLSLQAALHSLGVGGKMANGRV